MQNIKILSFALSLLTELRKEEEVLEVSKRIRRRRILSPSVIVRLKPLAFHVIMVAQEELGLIVLRQHRPLFMYYPNEDIVIDVNYWLTEKPNVIFWTNYELLLSKIQQAVTN